MIFKDDKKIYSFLTSPALSINDIIKTVNNKPILKIDYRVYFYFLKFYEKLPFPKIRFKSDSILSLMHTNVTPQNSITC